MDSDSEEDDDVQEDSRNGEAMLAATACRPANDDMGAAQMNGGLDAKGELRSGHNRLPLKYQPPELAAPSTSKRKSMELDGYGECGQHAGPCNDRCELHVAGPGDGESHAKQQAAVQQAVAQRQPKRRRKKLHDLSGVGALGITGGHPAYF